MVADLRLTGGTICVLEQGTSTLFSTGSIQDTGNRPKMSEKLLTGM